MVTEAEPLGERIKVARRYAGLTQEELADRAGVNVDTIRKLEQGRRQGARMATVNALARALGVPTITLVEPGEPTNGPLTDLRRALTPAAAWTPGADEPPPDLDTLSAGIGAAWRAYHRGDFATLGRMLPGLVEDARAAADDTGRPAARTLYAKTLQLAGHTLVQHHDEGSAMLVLQQARQATDDELVAAMMAASASWVFMREGRLIDAEHVAVRVADEIGVDDDQRRAAVHGGLLLTASMAAARADRIDVARDITDAARRLAAQSGESDDPMTSAFGPAVVAMHAVQVESTVGEWSRALALTRQVPPAGGPLSWRVRYLLDVAQAQAETYRDSAAVETLLSVRAHAPDWMRRQRLAHSVVRTLAGRRRPPRRIGALADFLGIPR